MRQHITNEHDKRLNFKAKRTTSGKYINYGCKKGVEIPVKETSANSKNSDAKKQESSHFLNFVTPSIDFDEAYSGIIEVN